MSHSEIFVFLDINWMICFIRIDVFSEEKEEGTLENGENSKVQNMYVAFRNKLLVVEFDQTLLR